MVINTISQTKIPSDLRRVHRSLVMRRLFSSENVSRAELAEESNLSAMAITRIVRELLEVGLIEEIGKRDRKGAPGRRRTNLQINSSGSFVVGLVISAFGHEVALMDANGMPLLSRRISFDNILNAEQTIDSASDVIIDLINQAHIDTGRILGIGIAIAGFVQSSTGNLLRAPYLGWHEIELGRHISARTGLPVIAENIADAINLAEQATAKHDINGDLFLVHASVTCGGSFTHQGSLVRGANHSAGYIGHLPAGPSQLICSCGASDCLNAHASGWSVLANLALLDSHTFRTDRIEMYADTLTALLAKNPDTTTPEGKELYKAGIQLGRGLRNVALIIDPEAIVLAGKMANSTAYVAGCRSAWHETSPRQLQKVPELIIGATASLTAAGFLALDKFLLSPGLNIDALHSPESTINEVQIT
jgi:N-acetylglucosamine repressor